MTVNARALDPKSRLALACSALARAGQQLSTASSADQARNALLQVATQLETDGNLSTLIPVEEITRKCRETASSADETPLVAACRQLATTLARRASSLAAELQQKVVAAHAEPTPSPVPPPSPVPAPPVAPAIPAHLQPTPQPAEAPAPKPRVDPARIRELTIAATTEEREAVRVALETGSRFAPVGDALLIDTRANRMWLSYLLPATRYADVLAALPRLDIGGYGDWRLPSPDEFRRIIDGGGFQALRSMGVLPAVNAPLLWSSDFRSRFFGLRKSVCVANGDTGELIREPASSTRVQVLAVRGG